MIIPNLEKRNNGKVKFSVYDCGATHFAGEYVNEKGETYEVSVVLHDGKWRASNPYLEEKHDVPVIDINPMMAICKYIKLAEAVKECYGVPWIDSKD